MKLLAYANHHWEPARDIRTLEDPRVVYKWTGQVYEPVDQLGLYGLDPMNPANGMGGVAKRFIATGDSGQGVASGTEAISTTPSKVLLPTPLRRDDRIRHRCHGDRG